MAGQRDAGRPETRTGPADQDDVVERSKATEMLWTRVRVDPVEIALPPGRSGYTLRAYRLVDQVTPTDLSEREEESFPERRSPVPADEEDVFGDEFDEDEETEPDGDGEDEEPDEDTDTDLSAEDEESAEPEEIPVFLSHRGRLLLFRSEQGLVDFVRSDAEHDLSQLDTWTELRRDLRAEDVVPLADDTYELDLVVENLRAGHDGWDSELIIKAGEVARDIAYALRIEPVIAALAPGSPLDDLDEALRASTEGGLGKLLARRRLRKIGAEAASLGWRTIIGKISALVDWRD